MSILVKLCFASLIAVSMIPGASLVSLQQTSQQQITPTPPTDADKQPEIPAKPHQRPNPDSSGKYHVGDGVTPPILIHSVEPELGRNIGKARCMVALTVGTDGKPTDVHLPPSSSDPKNEDNANLAIETRRACIDAAEQYRFKPAVFQGKPVAVDLRIEILFKRYP